MYADIAAGGRSSLSEWERPFLVELRQLVAEALAQNPTATINAISSDYADVSAVVAIALQAAGLPTANRPYPASGCRGRH